MLDEGEVEITSTELSVVSGRLDGQLTFGECDNGNRVIAVSDIDETDVSRRLGVLGEIGFGDSVTESDGGGVVDESERVQASNSSGVGNSSSLDIGVVSRDGNDDIGNGLLQLDSSSVT